MHFREPTLPVKISIVRVVAFRAVMRVTESRIPTTDVFCQ